MIEVYSDRSRQLKAFTKLVALVCLNCLLFRLTTAQEKTNSSGVTQWGSTPKSLTPSPLADKEPSTANFTAIKLTIPVPFPRNSNLKQTVNPFSSTTQPEVTVPPQNDANERNGTKPFFRSDFDEGIMSCKDGLILRYWRPIEGVSKTERIIRGILYFLAMCYLLIGVAIASDRFMESIEVITSSEKRVTVLNKNGQKETISVRVWSETVANLTLMALGSSAPEILLSIIEMFQKNFEAGDLGPATIVGSAAYNLFIIIAICMVVIPKGQVRKIRDFRVFVVTSVWSIFAYIWMCLIVKYITPGVIDIWEGLLTFLFFPILVYHAYITERRLFCPKCYKQSYETNQRGIVVGRVDSAEQGKHTVRTSIKDLVESPEMREFEETRREYIIKLKELRRSYPEYNLEKIQAMAQEQLIKDSNKSRAFYRVHTVRHLTGGPDVLKRARDFAFMEISEAKVEARMQGEEDEEFYDDFETRIYFEPGHYTVMENVGDVEVHVIRGGNLKHLTTVEYYTEDGTAQAGTDYVAVRGVLEFAPGIELQTIKIRIIDDDVFEEDEHFYVHLKHPSTEAVLVAPKVATIMTLDDDHCGIFGFKETKHQIPETVQIYEIFVKRYLGALGRVIVPYYTQEKTAISGKEYMDVSGLLVFEHGVVEQIIEVEIIEEHSFEKDVVFEVYLGEPRIAEDDSLYSRINEVKLKRHEERTKRERVLVSGQPTLLDDKKKIQCHITESEEFRQTVNKLVQTANASKLIGTTSWKEQFVDALTVSGRGDFDSEEDYDEDEVEIDEDQDIEEKIGPSGGEYFMHFISIFWKICFAVIPPAKLHAGYPCFFVSIVLIGICTAVLADVSSHFGCTLGVLDSVTAICFVALGTSLPDTFASKVAAVHDKTADNAIGNVTGSNAVNIFLGIGIAWSMAAIYHAVHGNQFIVPIGSLLFSTALFLIEASAAFLVLIFRRKKSIGGELGGPVNLKWIHCIFFVALWIVYLIFSTLEAYHIIPGF